MRLNDKYERRVELTHIRNEVLLNFFRMRRWLSALAFTVATASLLGKFAVMISDDDFAHYSRWREYQAMVVVLFLYVPGYVQASVLSDS